MDVYGRVHLCVCVPMFTRCMLEGKQLTNTGSQVAAAGAGLHGRRASEQRRLSVLPGGAVGLSGIKAAPRHFCPLVLSPSLSPARLLSR